jgi:hypothetical protein
VKKKQKLLEDGSVDLEVFDTPAWTVRRLLEAWQPRPGRLVEPFVGSGVIVRNIRGPQWNWVGYEIRDVPQVAHEHHQGDFFSIAQPDPTVVAAISNTPYTRAEEALLKCRALYPNADVMFLLRSAFAASKDRAEKLWPVAGVPDVRQLPNRPCFKGNGSDQAEYTWMCWPAGAPRQVGLFMVLALTSKEERKAEERRG